MDYINSALSLITTIRSVASTDTAVYHQISELSNNAVATLVEIKEVYDGLDGDHQSRITKDVSEISRILEKAIEISNDFGEASLVSRAYKTPDFTTKVNSLSTDLARATASVRATLDSCALEITGNVKEAISELRSSLLSTLGNFMGDRGRVAQLIGLEDMSMEEKSTVQEATSLALSGTVSPMGSLDRLYLEQKLSLLANTLVTIPEVPIDEITDTLVSEAKASYVPPTTAGNAEDAEDHVLETLGLLDSLDTPTTLDKLADQLGNLYLRVKTHFEMFEPALAIVRVEVTMRQKAVSINPSKLRRLYLGRAWARLATVTSDLKDFPGALKASLEAHTILRDLSLEEPAYQFGNCSSIYASHLNNHARYFYGLGRFTEAIATVEEADAQYARALALGHKERSLFAMTTTVHARYMILVQLGRCEDAERPLRELESIAFEWCSTDTGVRDTTITGVQTLALVASIAPPLEALRIVTKAHEAFDRASDFGDLSKDHTQYRQGALYALSLGYQQAGSQEEALRTAKMSLSSIPLPIEALQQADIDDAVSLLNLANLLFAASAFGECRATVDDTLKICERMLLNRRPLIAATLAEALVISASLQIHEDDVEGESGTPAAELERAIGLWEELMGEMPVRAKKGLERARMVASGTVEPATVTEPAMVTKPVVSKSKWKVWRKQGKT